MRYNSERNRQLATEPIGSLLKKFALPTVISLSASAIYALADTVFLGHAVGSVALSAMAVCLPVVMLIAAFGALCYVGVNTLIAAFLADNDNSSATCLFGVTLKQHLLITAIVMTGGYLAMEPLLRLTGASDAVMPYAIEYMEVYLLGTLPTYVVYGLSGILRIIGHPRRSMAILLVCIALNIIIDPIFIFILDWGMKGAAWATVLCHTLAAIYIIYCFADKTLFVHFTRKMITCRPKMGIKAFQIGLQTFGISVGGCIIVTVLNRMLVLFGGNDGDMYLCAYIIVYRITQLLIKSTVGLGQAMSQITGFNYREKLFHRVRLAISKTIAVATVIMVVGYGLIAIFPDAFTIAFTADEQVLDICRTALRIGLCTFPFVAAQLMVVAFFSSIRKNRLSMFISLSRQIVFLLPMLILLPRVIGVEGVWWAMCLADVYSVAISWGLLWIEMKKMHESYKVSQALKEHIRSSMRRHADTTATPKNGFDINSLTEDQLRQQLKNLIEERRSLKKQLQYEASTDDLTGLMNRNAGENAVTKMLASGASGMFVIFDCDRFKSINDNIGHQTGDVVLKEVANAMRLAFSRDICFRLGGDEFAACLQEDTIERNLDGDIDIDATFEPLKENLAKIKVPEVEFELTVSGGAIYFANAQYTFQDVYINSDKALQDSKKTYHHGVICLAKPLHGTEDDVHQHSNGKSGKQDDGTNLSVSHPDETICLLSHHPAVLNMPSETDS